MPRETDPELTAKEIQIAERAATLAVSSMTDSFYREVGKTVVNRFFIIVGAIAVGFVFGKGWINLSQIFGK